MEADSILVAQTAYLGDVVLTTPLLDAIRSAWPAAAIDVLVRPELAPVIRGHRSGAEPVGLDKRGADRGPLAALRAAWRLGRRGYDIAVSPHRSLRTALTLKLAGIGRRLGFADAAGSWLYTDTVERDESLHEVERILSLLSNLGIDVPDSPELSMAVDDAAAERVAEMLDAAGVSRGSPVVGVNPGSVWATKRWLPERFADLIDRLVHELGMQAVIIGGPQEVALCNRVVELCDSRPASLAGRTSVAELAALISALSIYVTNDSGPMHAAAALDVPIVAIFGSTVPGQGYAPYTSNSEVVQIEGIDCRPCGPHGRESCPLGHFRCMIDLDVEHVMAKLIMIARRNRVL